MIFSTMMLKHLDVHKPNNNKLLDSYLAPSVKTDSVFMIDLNSKPAATKTSKNTGENYHLEFVKTSLRYTQSISLKEEIGRLDSTQI